MNAEQIRSALIGLSYLLAVALGWAACHFWERQTPVPVTDHAMHCTAGGTSCQAARSSAPAAPAQKLPAGAKPQATFHAVVGGGKPVAKPGAAPADVAHCLTVLQCPAITVNGTVVTQKDGQPDLYVSTDGNQVQEADFHPGASVELPQAHPNRASLTRWSGGGWTGAYERDLWGPVFAGVQGGELPGQGAAVGVTLGARW